MCCVIFPVDNPTTVRADAFVERIEGSFTNVVGLPMELLTGLLKKRGYSPLAPAKDPAANQG